MSDNLDDTPELGKKWCPTCEPERDLSKEILLVQYCTIHEPSRVGDDDSKVDSSTFFGVPSGTYEADGVTNKLMSDLLKKRKKK